MLIIDDVLATGGTAAAAVELVERLGGVVVGLGFLVELAFLHGRDRLAGRDVTTLVTLRVGPDVATVDRVSAVAQDHCV